MNPSAELTLADVVAAVGSLKRLNGVGRAAAKLHLRAVVGDPKHSAVPHVDATETGKNIDISRNLLLPPSRGRSLLQGFHTTEISFLQFLV